MREKTLFFLNLKISSTVYLKPLKLTKLMNWGHLGFQIPIVLEI